MTEKSQQEFRDLLEQLSAAPWNGLYQPKCDDCSWDGGTYLLGPVALRHALQHTKDTHHKVSVLQGV